MLLFLVFSVIFPQATSISIFFLIVLISQCLKLTSTPLDNISAVAHKKIPQSIEFSCWGLFCFYKINVVILLKMFRNQLRFLVGKFFIKKCKYLNIKSLLRFFVEMIYISNYYCLLLGYYTRDTK